MATQSAHRPEKSPASTDDDTSRSADGMGTSCLSDVSERETRLNDSAAVAAAEANAAPLGVLVVGQTPPPHHGQAVMIQRLLDSPMEGVRMYHVRTAFSKSISDLGRLQIGKIGHLLAVIIRIYVVRITSGARVLYYPPSGPNVVPVLKDIVILLCTRWLFRQTILHVHAGGISHAYPKLNAWLRPLFRWALYDATAVIRLSDATPQDGIGLRAEREFLVPNGIPDAKDVRDKEMRDKEMRDKEMRDEEMRAEEMQEGPTDREGIEVTTNELRGMVADVKGSTAHRPLRVLYVGALCESKGVLDLVEACHCLQDQGTPFQLDLVGACQSEDFRVRLNERLAAHELQNSVRLHGVLTGDDKYDRFEAADVFCFPSFYECEAFPLVLLEALCFGLPVVATRWRGIPSIIRDQETGFLVEPHEPENVAARLRLLAEQPSLRDELGLRARQRFLQEYTADKFAQRMHDVFRKVAASR